jgi:TonB family protein
MNLKKIILSAALLGGVLSASAFATTADAHSRVVTKAANFQAPAIAKMVAPTGLSRRIEGATVMLSLNIDEHGQPSNIQVMSRDAQSSTNSLVAAVSQWQFTPAKKNGVAVPSKVVLPVELVESNS